MQAEHRCVQRAAGQHPRALCRHVQRAADEREGPHSSRVQDGHPLREKAAPANADDVRDNGLGAARAYSLQHGDRIVHALVQIILIHSRFWP